MKRYERATPWVMGLQGPDERPHEEVSGGQWQRSSFTPSHPPMSGSPNLLGSTSRQLPHPHFGVGRVSKWTVRWGTWLFLAAVLILLLDGEILGAQHTARSRTITWPAPGRR